MSGEYKADLVGQIIDYESGNMSGEETIRFFQGLVDSGMAWKLQGSYGRTAMSLIKAGLVHVPTQEFSDVGDLEPN